MVDAVGTPSAARRKTREVLVGTVGVGGDNPIRIQSMTTSDTLDVEATAAEVRRLVEAGCEIVRITAQTVKEARALGEIKRRLGFDVPLVADIHFSPSAALEAAKHVEKVRINPGNFADTKQFRYTDLSDEEYERELERVAAKFRPLVRFCKEHGVAMRIGTNHGSLSDRILSRYGDTPLGMVESALEFARIARDEGYHEMIFSMKASNPRVCLAAYRLLVRRMEAEGMDYPLHLGVTEAGDGEDGRIKSAVGIGTLLAEGLGDTVRVSLTEDPVAEVPVARELVRIAEELRDEAFAAGEGLAFGLGPAEVVKRRASKAFEVAGLRIGGGEAPVRVGVRLPSDYRGPLPASGADEVAEVVVGGDEARPFPALAFGGSLARLSSSDEEIPPRARIVGLAPEAAGLHAYRALAERAGDRPIELSFRRRVGESPEATVLRAGIVLGGPLAEGIGDLVTVEGEDPVESVRLAYAILQNTGARITRTEYVACPSCGRTLFDLVEVTARVKAATSHLKNVKIAVMGCVVNGPGEMADADFGFVGGAPGKVNLYVRHECVEKGIPMDRAVDALLDLIERETKRKNETPR